jgi:endonuclease YncB( thermonuclease family)
MTACHRRDRVVFFNNEATNASNPMTAFRIARVVDGDTWALRTNKRESDGETKYANEVNYSKSLFSYRAPQLLSLLDC